MLLLEQCDGPECPRCGCRDAKILQAPRPAGEASGSWFGSKKGGNGWFAAGRAECQNTNCGMRFTFREVPEAEAE